MSFDVNRYIFFFIYCFVYHLVFITFSLALVAVLFFFFLLLLPFLLSCPLSFISSLLPCSPYRVLTLLLFPSGSFQHYFTVWMKTRLDKQVSKFVGLERQLNNPRSWQLEQQQIPSIAPTVSNERVVCNQKVLCNQTTLTNKDVIMDDSSTNHREYNNREYSSQRV